MASSVREVELGRVVTAHFDRLGGVAFPEVACWAAGDRADLVVVRSDGSLDLVEMKRSPCRKLVDQIRGWSGHADRLWVAYDPPRRGERVQRWRETFRSLGVGVLHVVDGRVEVSSEAQEATIWPGARGRLVATLHPLHAVMGEAGNAESRFYTPFRHTCDSARAALLAAPGLCVRELVGRIAHHYTSDKVARSSLLKWIRIGKVPGIEARAEGNAVRLFATDTRPEGTEG